jgi:hypothetical protein
MPFDKTNPLYWYVIGNVIGELHEAGILDTQKQVEVFGYFHKLSIKAGEPSTAGLHAGKNDYQISKTKKS